MIFRDMLNCTHDEFLGDQYNEIEYSHWKCNQMEEIILIKGSTNVISHFHMGWGKMKRIIIYTEMWVIRKM